MLVPKPIPIPFDIPITLALVVFGIDNLDAKGADEISPPIMPVAPPRIPLAIGRANFSIADPFDKKTEGKAQKKPDKPPCLPPLRIALSTTCLVGCSEVCAKLLDNAIIERQRNNFFCMRATLMIKNVLCG